MVRVVLDFFSVDEEDFSDDVSCADGIFGDECDGGRVLRGMYDLSMSTKY